MNDDDIERTLRGAFDAQARAAVGDHASPPPPRFATSPAVSGRSHGRLVRWAAPLTAAAAVVAVVGIATAVSRSSSHDDHRAAATGTLGASLSSNPSTNGPTVDANTVHVRLLNDDHANYGVGMPVIAFFSRNILSAKTLQQVTRATVDGRPVQGAWFFEKSDAGKGPIEAHFRPEFYWKAHADVHVSIPIKGLSAGGGLVYDDSLTTDFHTGARRIATVYDSKHEMVVTSDGKPAGTFKVSLGAKTTPTRPGVKVIMEKSRELTLRTASDQHTHIQYAQRLTYGGEYLCAAPWNEQNIKAGVNSSGGGTNLLTPDAKTLFGLLQIGDVVEYRGVTGAPMQLSSGYGDWNVSWPLWLTGGYVPTH